MTVDGGDLAVCGGLVAASYLLGAVPSGLLIVRARRGFDVRRFGSGSSGATNVLRVAGWGVALPVLALDMAKGALAAAVAALLAPSPGWVWPVAAAAGLAAVVGHVVPIWAGFHGGKGVATSAGAALALAPLALGISLAIFGLVLAVGRRVSAASIAAALALPLSAWATGRPWAIGFAMAASVVVLLAHRANLRSLAEGREPRLARYGGYQRRHDSGAKAGDDVQSGESSSGRSILSNKTSGVPRR